MVTPSHTQKTMNASPSLELLFATYNSEVYLRPLLESLVQQTHDDFVLLVSDDGSSDATLAVLDEFTPRFRHPVRHVHGERPSGSAMRNFGHLLEQASADYVMLVDHDDVWHADKIERGLQTIAKAEAVTGRDRPALAHSDLAVIDGAGNPVQPSFWAMKQIDPTCSKDLRRTLIHASVVGCTSTLNRALVEACLPVPGDAVMHDWWISLVAAAHGTVMFDPAPRMDYRIHGNNVSNPRAASARGALKQSNYRTVMQQKLAVRARQAGALSQRLETGLPAAARLARAFAEIPDQGFFKRRLSLLRHRFFFPGVWRNLAMFLAV